MCQDYSLPRCPLCNTQICPFRYQSKNLWCTYTTDPCLLVYRLQEIVYLHRIPAKLPDDFPISSSKLRGLLRQAPPNAFTFHETCWTEFVRLFAPGKLSLNVLIEVCRDIPFSMTYQSYYDFPSGRQSWEFNSKTQSPVFNLAVCPTLTTGRHGEKQELGIFDRRLRSLCPPEKQWDRDIFQDLTFDILMIIASFLPVEDVIKLCSVSKATYAAKCLFQCQSFWKSRFFVDGEQGYLNWLLDKETKLSLGETVDWKRIFFRARSLLRGPLAIRQIKIGEQYHHFHKYWYSSRHEEERWRRRKWFRDRCKMVQPSRSTLSLPLDYSIKSLNWQKVMCDLTCDANTCLANWTRRGRCIKGRHPKLNRTVVVHPSLYRISFNILDEKDGTYISGMEFMFKDPKVPHGAIGYKIPGKETTVEVDPSELLRGFEISYSERGIEAVRLLTSSTGNRPSRLLSPRWMGKRRSLNTTKTRLVSNSEMMVIEGKFDVSNALYNPSVMKCIR